MIRWILAMIELAVAALVGSPFLSLLFVLSAYGWWILLSRDTIFDRPRNWFYRKWPHEGYQMRGSHGPKRGRSVYSGNVWYTEKGTFWGDLLHCPFCSGWWIAVAQLLVFAYWSPLAITIPGILHGTRIAMGFLSSRA